MFLRKFITSPAKLNLFHIQHREFLAFPQHFFKMASYSTNTISTSACLIIGDEVLNGKIQDTNSNWFAKYCFDLGIPMRRVVVVPDEETDIRESIIDLCDKHDFVITSGGIGPTHDDITYESIAKAFNLPLKLHQETVDRMSKLSKFNFTGPGLEEARSAQLQMATLPTGPNVRYIYTSDELWVPIVSINSKVYIFPGIPRLFKTLLQGIRDEIESRVKVQKNLRFYVTTKWPESKIAPCLSKLQSHYNDKGIKIGSYPHIEKGINTVSIIGSSSDNVLLENIVKEIEASVEGQQVSAEEESQNSTE